MPDNIPSIGEFVKSPVKQKTKQPVYIPPEQVDFSKLNINPADMQIVSPEQNILQVHPEFKTTVTKQPITPEEEKAVGEYFKLYDEATPKAELETNIIKPITEHFKQGVEQVKQGDLEKGALNLALGVEKGITSPLAVLDQATRKIPVIGNTVADIVSAPFMGVDKYMEFAGNTDKHIKDWLGIKRPDPETEALIDDFARTTAQFVVAPFIVKGLKMGYDKLPFNEKKTILADVTNDIKTRMPEFADIEAGLKQPPTDIGNVINIKPDLEKPSEVGTPTINEKGEINPNYTANEIIADKTVHEFIKPFVKEIEGTKNISDLNTIKNELDGLYKNTEAILYNQEVRPFSNHPLVKKLVEISKDKDIVDFLGDVNLLRKFTESKIGGSVKPKVDIPKIEETTLPEEIKPFNFENLDKRLIEEPTGVAETPPEITTTEPTITVPEGKKMRGFFKRIKNKIAETLGPDIRDNIVKNPETYYEPQNLESIKSNLKDLTDSDLISAMSDEGLLRIPTSKDANNNIYVLKELERYNRALARGDKPLAENIINDLNGIGTTLGQLIRQYREFKTSTPDGVLELVKKQLEESKRQLSPEQEKSLTDLSDSYFQEYNKLVELDRVVKKDYTPENIDARLKQAEIVADRQNALDKYVYQVTPRGMWDTFSTILKGNLLTFQSLLQNPASNIILAVPRYGAKLLGTPFDWAFSKITGKPRQIQHGFDLLWQTVKDTGAETWDALKKLKTGNIATPQSKYELKYGLKPMVSLKQALTGKNLPLNNKGKVAFYDRLQRGIEGSMGIYPEAMFRLLNLGDQPFSKPTYKNALRELGKSKGLEGIELKKFTDYPDEVSRKTAEQEALESVFAQDNRIADWVIQLKYSLGKMPVVGSLMKFISDSIVPYVKVPANFVVEVTDFMIPALSFAKGIYHFSKGNSRKGSIYIGKSIVGASMLKATNVLVDNGIITGSPSTIEKERELQFDVRQPNSINISALKRMMNGESVDWQAGDQVISYNKFGILGAFFGVMSDVPKKEKDANNKWLDDVYDLTIGALTNYPKVFKYAFDQSFLKGTNTLLSTLASGKLEDYDKLVQTWMNTVFSVFVPNQMSAVTRAHFEYMPEKRNQDSIEKLDYLIKERTLQYGAIEKDYPSKVGLWGEKIKQTPTGANAWFYNLFDLSKGQTADSDPLSNEILKLYNATNDLDVVPSVPKDKIMYNGQEIELKGKRYEQFKIHVGEERRKLFEKLVANPDYQALTPENKLLLVKQAWDKGMDTGKDLMFKSEIEKKKKDKIKKPYLKDFIKKESSKSYFYLPN